MKKVSVVPSLWLLCGLASKEFYALHNIRVAHFWFYSSVSETESHKIHFVLFWILQKFRSNWRSFRPILEKNAFNKFNVNNLSFLKLCKIWKSDIDWFFWATLHNIWTFRKRHDWQFQKLIKNGWWVWVFIQKIPFCVLEC